MCVGLKRNYFFVKCFECHDEVPYKKSFLIVNSRLFLVYYKVKL